MHIVIIGNGIAGITTARHVRKLSDHQITVISSESEYFFSRTALMYIYMGHMKFEHTQPYENWFWKKNRIDLVFDRVTELDTDAKTLQLKTGKSINYDKLVLALGSVPRPLPTPGANLKGVQPLYSKQDLEQLEETTKGVKQAVVIGGGLIGIELAEMLHSRGIHVTMAVREKSYWDIVLPKEEAEMISKHIKARGIDLRLDTLVGSIHGAEKVDAVTLNTGETLACQFVGATIGVMPNIKFVEDSPIETNRGILVDEHLQTNIEDVFAIGDCAEIRTPDPGRRPIEAVWYTGRIMGETLAETLCGTPTPYRPGIWYNSAKFMDLEYQTYGQVPTTYEEDLDSLYWEDIVAERCLRIVYEKATKKVKGFNALGLRLRHELCDEWIAREQSLAYVLEHLEQLDFDPEFYTNYLSKAKANLEAIA
ncbi:MAG: NAD(P)/FAD-dependent oxidoreductase [Cyclobacteriaceae bacterium]|nr:NAD(P)/FAD-dependent oxidoreductase [Cyclobacteriaceae bacterium]